MKYIKSMQKSNELFNIRQVIELTGVTEFTLRGWENRYKAFVPRRTRTGRRLYSKADILKIQALRRLVERGQKIGQIALLKQAQLEKILSSQEPAAPVSLPENLQEAVSGVNQFDWDKVRRCISENRTKSKELDYLRQFIWPLILEMNYKVQYQRWTVAQEHILSAMIKEELYFIKAKKRKIKNNSKRFVFATPEKDYHEIGILYASALASIYSYDSLYLGPNVPKEDLCEACLRFKATDLVIAGTILKSEGAKEDPIFLIDYLNKNLNKKMTLYIAGRTFSFLQNPTGKKKMIRLNSMNEFNDIL